MVKYKCFFEGCPKQRTHGFITDKLPSFCRDHAEKTMENKRERTCIHADGCPKRCSFGYPEDKVPSYCAEHCLVNMINITIAKCQHEGCPKNAGFGYPSSTKMEFCSDHSLPDMEDKRSIAKLCACGKRASFGFPDDKKAMYCNDCKIDGMVNITSYKCKCGVIASFGEPEDAKPTCCKNCASNTMINMKTKPCATTGCPRHATCGKESDRKRVFCTDHCPSDMICLSAKYCQYEGCGKYAAFGPDRTKIVCATHNYEGYPNTNANLCRFEGCPKEASYGNEGDVRPTYCAPHAPTGMTSIKQVKCDKCGTGAKFGFPALKATRCVQHIEDGMIKNPRQRCHNPNCKETSTHLCAETKKRYCEDHAPSTAVNQAQHPCQKCDLLYVLNAEGVCQSCSDFKLAKGVKEKEIAALLDREGVDYFSHDRMIDFGECVKYRPDFLIDAMYHMVVLEVDENQHKGYPCECEQTRMVNIANALGMPTTFVRYNPDDFKGSTVTRAKRHDLLLRWLRHSIEHSENPMNRGAYCQSVYLFYDGHDDANIQWQTVVAME